jgi:glyoxylase-like metal-dependent hydrolase (beta-lactamase superfamily II)
MRVLIAILVFIGAGVYWFILDGSTPKNADYEFPIAEMRALIDADDGPLPTALNVEIISTDEAPLLAAHAGFHFKPFHLAMTSFQVKGGNGDGGGDIIIGGAMDKSLYEPSTQSDNATFSDAGYRRMLDAMRASDATLITHEHIDHIGGIVRAPDPAALAPHLMLSASQIDAMAEFAADGQLVPVYKTLAPADLSSPRLLAPGVVVAPTPGHSPGSQVFLIRIENGQEYLLIGDIVWAMKNVEKAWGRPRLLQYMFFKEDRAQVQRQVRALHELSAAEPALILLPSHDKDWLDGLIATDTLGKSFQ